MRTVFAVCLSLLAAPLASQDNPAVIAARTDLLEGRAEQALPVLHATAEAGDPRALSLLGTAAERGWGGPVDMTAAVQWYERAADLGYPRAMYNLGWIFRYGDGGIMPDPQRARAEYARAAALDYSPATAEYGDMLFRGQGGPADVDLGLVYLRMGAQMGDSDALQWLATAYLEGRYMEQDDAEARRLNAASAAQANWTGQTNLATMAEAGRGGPVDLELAAENYRAAMASGFDLAGVGMARLIGAHPEVDPRPLAREGHCLWALELATRHGWPSSGWLGFCRSMVEELTAQDRNAAAVLAKVLVPDA
jgi:TPR repeat protein